MFYHSLFSDWNHGNAHFLRGVCRELNRRGHEVEVLEPVNSWSMLNLVAEHGLKPVRKLRAVYPELKGSTYDVHKIDLDRVLEGVDLVMVHEWNDPVLVGRIGEHHKRIGGYKLLFHDTHHRMVTAPENMACYDLSGYDGVLAYGQVLRDLYEKSGRVQQAWVWHEAADTTVFHPVIGPGKLGDLVWVGNWGDGERTAEIQEYLIGPVESLKLKAVVYGVRYPEEAQTKLSQANVAYGNWLPNYEVPRVFSQYKATIHIPRRPYTQALPGIPTIRVFEALACGIPLLCSYWEDCESLFGRNDYLVAHTGKEMISLLQQVLNEPELAKVLVSNGLRTIQTRHTCAHRVDELMQIISKDKGDTSDKRT